MADTTLDDWAATLAAELGVDSRIDVERILALAADAAHAVVRPAAPLTTFMAGLAAGLAGGTDAAVAEALSTASDACGRAAHD